MSVSAVIENGKVQENYSTKSTESTSNGYDQDAFMKILSAQMKYQDPLFHSTHNSHRLNSSPIWQMQCHYQEHQTL